MKLILYSDGGAKRNPGPAAIGVVIYNSKGKILKEISKYIGQATNNQAEYQALIVGLKEAKKLKANELKCFLDSKLIVQQVNCKYKIKDKNLSSLFIKVWNLLQSFKKVEICYISRKKNKKADNLVKLAFKKFLQKDKNLLL